MIFAPPRHAPVDYSKCNQTVTVYHKDGDTVTRTLFCRAFLDFKKVRNIEKTGSRDVNSFLLVIPGADVQLFPQDKVLLGRGPEIDGREGWASLIPAKAPGLVVIQYVDPKYFEGRQIHVEAGG